MPRLSYKKLIQQHVRILKSLEYESGLFAASKKSVSTGYDKAWLRDNFYECLAFEVIGDFETVLHTYKTILKIFLRHEFKIDAAISHKPVHSFEYIHPRYHPKTFDEYWEDWGNKQNDSIGAILFKIGELEGVKKHSIIEGEDEQRIVQKLVRYLESIHYWCDADNGMWENDEEVHASSVGACVAGLRMLKRHADIDVPQELIDHGVRTLHYLLPRESQERFVDLALLSLIWPYDVVSAQQRKDILENVEYHLVKSRGLIRYRNDWYYNRNPDKRSEEAEWTFGFSWLAIIYKMLGNRKKSELYEKKALEIITPQGVPELYFSNSPKHNENNPLGWAESLFIVALYEIHEKHRNKKFRMVQKLQAR
ncbi:MAG: glycoside hydrolase family 15 protein [Nanoarchaeota archaeon]